MLQELLLFHNSMAKKYSFEEEKKIISKKSVQTHRFWVVDEDGGRQKMGEKETVERFQPL